MRKPTRREMLAGLIAAPVVAAVAETPKVKYGLKELPKPVIKFEEGVIVNHLELLDGIPFVRVSGPSEVYTRLRKVWVTEPVFKGYCGWMELRETNYVSDLEINSVLAYQLLVCEETQQIINRNFVLGDDKLRKDFLEKARKQLA